MKIAVVTREELARFRPTSPDGEIALVADALRDHALALGVTLRRVLLDRTRSALAPLWAPDPDRIEEIERELERHGDLIAGDGGLVAPAPLRAVPLGPRRYLLASALPTRLLRAEMDVEVTGPIARRINLTDEQKTRWGALIARFGGVEIDVAQWSGLSRTPRADAAWLALLGERLAAEGAQQPDGIRARWDAPEFYRTGAEEPPGWRRITSSSFVDGPALLRARQAGGWWAFGWGVLRGGDALPNPFVPLDRDDATRSTYALDRRAGAARIARLIVTPNEVQLSLGGLVPIAEYRHISALASHVERAEGTTVYHLPHDARGSVVEMLHDRLGLRVEESTP